MILVFFSQIQLINQNFGKRVKNFEKYITKYQNLVKKTTNLCIKPTNLCINIQKCQNMYKICANSLAHTKYALITFERSIHLSQKCVFCSFITRTFQGKICNCIFYVTLFIIVLRALNKFSAIIYYRLREKIYQIILYCNFNEDIIVLLRCR